MSVLTIAELKARFSSTDRPSQKDFDDLIDTLLAGAGLSTPTGSAGGDLAGSTYPNPVIAADTVTFAKLQNITSGRLLGRSSLSAGDTEEIEVGSGLLLSGSKLSWTGGGGGSGGAGTVAGAISTWASDPIEITNVDGNLALAQADVAFGSTLPQLIRVTAVCRAPFANYSTGDEVPLEYFRDKTDPETPSFGVSAYITGGQATVKIKVELGNIAGSVGIAVYDRDITTGPGPADPSLVPFTPGTPPETYFYLKVYMTRYAPGTGLGSLALFEPADQTLPVASGVATFTHNYQDVPSLPVLVHMVCVISDATTGHTAGESVPINNAYETGFANPAFGVTLTGSTVLVRREAATIEIPHKTTGALTAITADVNWQIRVRTARGVNLPSIAFPALSFTVANPMCAWTYNNLLYVIHNDGGLDKTFLCCVDMTTNQITLARQYVSQSLYGNVATFRLLKAGVPVDCFFLCDSRGVYRIEATDDGNETRLLSGDYHHYKVLDVDQSGLGGYDRPNLLYASCTYGSADTNNQTVRKAIWSAAYPSGSYDISSMPAVNWSTLAGIGGGTYGTYQALDQEAQILLHLSFNPIKRRLYMVHNGSGYMNIFTFDSPLTLYSWWVPTPTLPDGTKCDFDKLLIMPGGSATWTDVNSEHFFVEYDTVTGAEKAIVLVRRGNTSMTGSVCRIPWNE